MSAKNFFLIYFLNDRFSVNRYDDFLRNFLIKRASFFDVGIEVCNSRTDADLRLSEKFFSDSLTENIFLFSAVNPLFDVDLLDQALASVADVDSPLTCEGAVPGTQFQSLFPRGLDMTALNAENAVWRCHYQERINGQWDLRKYKRMKMFKRLVERFPQIIEMRTHDFRTFLEQDDVYEFCLAYGEDIKLEEKMTCPHCDAMGIGLETKISQPMQGFISPCRPTYKECQECGLVWQGRSIPFNQVGALYDEWDALDFCSAVRQSDNDFFLRFDREYLESVDLDVADIGCGTGAFAEWLALKNPSWRVTGFDFSNKLVESSRHFQFISCNFASDLLPNNSFDLIVSWEVIEHLPYERLSFFLDNIGQALRPGGKLILSTPNWSSPLCRLYDFFGITPSYHYMVFSEEWLLSFIQRASWVEGTDIKFTCDWLSSGSAWLEYAASTSANTSVSTLSSILNTFFLNLKDSRSAISEVSQKFRGAEMVITVKKRG